MKVQVGIEQPAKAVDEDDRANAPFARFALRPIRLRPIRLRPLGLAAGQSAKRTREKSAIWPSSCVWWMP